MNFPSIKNIPPIYLYLISICSFVISNLIREKSPLFYGIFLAVGLIGFGLSLFSFSKVGIELLIGFSAKDKNFLSGIGLYLLFIFFSFCFSVIIFRLTLLVNKVTTRENEKAELAKNSFLFSGIQSISFLFFIYLLADPVIRLALSLID